MKDGEVYKILIILLTNENVEIETKKQIEKLRIMYAKRLALRFNVYIWLGVCIKPYTICPAAILMTST